jgi:hypothetical protein
LQIIKFDVILKYYSCVTVPTFTFHIIACSPFPLTTSIFSEINSPFGNIFWCITLLGELVIDEAQLTALLPGGDSVEADEELGAVVGIRVLGMRVVLPELVGGRLLGALEAAGSLQS